MQALVFHEPGRITVDQIPDPKLGPGDVLIRVDAAGICASDLRVYRGEKHAAPGVVPGHEFTGTIVEVGPSGSSSNDDDGSIGIGSRVAVYPILACGGCDFCRRGFRNRCRHRETLGYDRNGGLAEFVLLPAALVRQGHAVAVPDSVPPHRAALTEPTACVLNSLESCRLQPGAAVAILGAGPMGLLHVALARALGAGPIIVSEPVETRRALAPRFGATVSVGAADGEAAAAVRDATGGRGADVVIVSVGLDRLTEQALELVAPQGAVNLFAGFPPGTTATIDVNPLHYNEVILTGTQNATPDQFRRTAALMPSLDVLDQSITHRFTMADAAQSYAAREDAATLKTMIFPHGDPPSDEAAGKRGGGA